MLKRSRKSSKTTSRRLLLDTNVLVYDTIGDSEAHSVAVELVDSASEIIIPSIVVHEYIWVMLRPGVNPLFVADKVGEYLNALEPSTFVSLLA